MRRIRSPAARAPRAATPPPPAEQRDELAPLHSAVTQARARILAPHRPPAYRDFHPPGSAKKAGACSGSSVISSAKSA